MANFKQFTNRSCEYFPCHETERINCLFCFCPLYYLDCRGDFTRTPKGLKDCSKCLIPHREGGYDYIVQKLKELGDSAT